MDGYCLRRLTLVSYLCLRWKEKADTVLYKEELSMKKYRYCFFLCLVFGVIALGAAVWWFSARNDKAIPDNKESETWMTESETVAEDRIVMNQEKVRPLPEKTQPAPSSKEEQKEEKKEYLLVSEDGFLLVFGNNAREICLYTHIPISDFPEEEQEKLRQGIWFSQMEEIYNYLESYTS